MTGWKTKTGIIIGVVGSALLSSANVCPIPDWIPWITFIGTIITAIGAGLGVYGLGSKIDRQGK